MVSKIHSNFIVNNGGATGRDAEQAATQSRSGEDCTKVETGGCLGIALAEFLLAWADWRARAPCSAKRAGFLHA